MIPKIIHYCWFGKGLMPQTQQDYIIGWKRLMPSWQFIRWDESNFDVDVCEYSKESYKEKKWAFVSDVARLLALKNYGGVYLDTDVELFTGLDPLLECGLFSGVECFEDGFEKDGRHMVDNDGIPITSNADIPYLGFLAAVLGSVPNHPLINDCLNYYLSLTSGQCKDIVIDGLLARFALKYGFRFIDKEQRFYDCVLLHRNVFTYEGYHVTPKTVLYHHAAQSWTKKNNIELLFLFLDKMHILKVYRGIKKELLSFL